MPGVLVAPGPYVATYETPEACIKSTFWHKVRLDEPYAMVSGTAFLLIPKNASQSLIAIGQPAAAVKGLIYAIIRDPVDRLISAWSDKTAWKRIPIDEFLDFLWANISDEIDVHLRPQIDLVEKYKATKFISFDNIDDELNFLGVRDFPHRNASFRDITVDSDIAFKIRQIYSDDQMLCDELRRPKKSGGELPRCGLVQ